MVYEGVRRAVKFVFSKLMANITILMGVFMMLYAAIGIYSDYRFEENMLQSVLIYSMPMLLGILILLDKHRSLFFAVGMYAVALGTSRFISYAPGIFEKDIFDSVMALVLTFLAVNLIYSGVRYMLSNSRGVIGVLIGSGAFSAMLAVDIIYYIVAIPDLELIIEDEGDNIITLIMILLYIVLVSSQKVRGSTNISRMARAVSGHRLTNVSGPDISMDPATVGAIMHFCDGTMPESKMTGTREGPVYYEYIFSFHDGIRYGSGFLHRWEGPEGPVYMTFSEHSKGSVFGSKTMRVQDVLVTGNRLIIGFEDSRTGVFRIRRPDEEDGPLFDRRFQEEAR